jgi:DNA-binding transcriptional LysR family regulator
MQREELVDLNAFIIIADEKNFTRAAAKLGTSQSALSHSLKRLEARLGVRLLNRTTRSVSTTDAGLQLLQNLRASFQDIASSLNAVSHLGSEPSGTIRLTATEHATEIILWPKIKKYLKDYPQVKLEININQAGADIVKDGFDAGVWLAHEIANDMIAVRVSPDIRKLYVASPDYLKSRKSIKNPEDLLNHDCITYRRPINNRVAPWEFSNGIENLQLRVDGRLVFNRDHHMINAALDGFGITCVLEERVESLIKNGQLVHILPEWSHFFPPLYLYYSSRREKTAAFTKLVEYLRFQAPCSN